MKKLLKYFKGYTLQCILGPLFKLLEASFELLIPLVAASIIDVGIKNGEVVLSRVGAMSSGDFASVCDSLL